MKKKKNKKIKSAIFNYDCSVFPKDTFLQQLSLSAYTESVKVCPVLSYSADIIKFPDSFVWAMRQTLHVKINRILLIAAKEHWGVVQLRGIGVLYCTLFFAKFLFFPLLSMCTKSLVNANASFNVC